MNKESYEWNYCSLGGVIRVKIASGEDLEHLGELDQKYWTVLSCPVSDLQMDKTLLDLMDTDKDGKIKVHEVVEASRWLCSVIKDKGTMFFRLTILIVLLRKERGCMIPQYVF